MAKYYLINKNKGSVDIRVGAERVGVWMLGRRIDEHIVIKSDERGEVVVDLSILVDGKKHWRVDPRDIAEACERATAWVPTIT